MAKKRIVSDEEAKAKSGKGFDTPIKSITRLLVKVALITLAVIAASMLVYYLAHSAVGDNESAPSGGIRNCILSVMGNPPQCSDNDGTLKDTYANGKYVGICRALDNSGGCIK